MLTAAERSVLDIESGTWRTAGAKGEAIRDSGMSLARHLQVLASLTGRADAWEYAPATVRQVRDRLDATRHRTGERHGDRLRRDRAQAG